MHRESKQQSRPPDEFEWGMTMMDDPAAAPSDGRPHHHHHGHEEERGRRPDEEAEAKPEDDAGLTQSVRQPPAAWKLSLGAGIVSLAVSEVLMAVPGTGRIDVGGGQAFSTALVLLIVPVIGLFWGMAALFTARYVSEQLRALGCVCLAMIAAGMMFWAATVDPAGEARRALDEPMRARESLTEEELAVWRQQQLTGGSPPTPEE